MRFSAVTVPFLIVSALAVPANTANHRIITATWDGSKDIHPPVPKELTMDGLRSRIPRAAPQAIGEVAVGEQDKSLSTQDKRQAEAALASAIISAVATVVGVVLQTVIDLVVTNIKAIVDGWTDARQKFTQRIVGEMMKYRPDSKWVAAACYNKGWNIRDKSLASEVVSVELKLGALHTDYDCMYLARDNQFYTWAEGGYQNLAYSYDSAACKYVPTSGDLHC